MHERFPFSTLSKQPSNLLSPLSDSLRHVFNQLQSTKSHRNQLARESAIFANFEFARAIALVTVVQAVACTNEFPAACQSTTRIRSSFTAHLSSSSPSGGLAFDRAGNLRGKTRFGGKRGRGTIFKIAL
jgi:hypothetical protein